MIPAIQTGLHPTLWRTCRALANRRRLGIIQLLGQYGDLSVSQVAQALDVSPATASQYLRALNARGLLAVRRQKRFVYYRLGANASIAHAARLLRAVGKALEPGGESLSLVFHILTGLTHPRRVEMLQLLIRQRMSFSELMNGVGASRPALSRHLKKLLKRNLITRGNGVYSVGQPVDELRRSLLHILKQGC